MTDPTLPNMTMQYTARVHKQHTSLVITIPKGICREMDISRGDILLFEVFPGEHVMAVGKPQMRIKEQHELKRD